MNILKRAKICLYPVKYELFGIAVVEAMAAGLVPVVNKSGGPWINIIKMGEFDFGFKDVNELIEPIERIMEFRETELLEFQIKARARIQYFSFDKIKKRASKVWKCTRFLLNNCTGQKPRR